MSNAFQTCDYNSTIFKTISSEVTGTIKSVGLFGLSLDELKNKINNIKAKGLKNGLFDISSINENIINSYNKSIENGIDPQKALETASKGANKATIELMKSTNGCMVEQDALTLAMNKSSLAAKAASISMKALSIVGNMIAMWAISKGIELAAKAIDNYVHRVEKAREALAESQSTYEATTREVETLTKQLDECDKKIKELENTKGITNLVDDSEYNKLRSTYDTLADMLLIKKEQQRIEGVQLAKDAEKVLTTKVTSEFAYAEGSEYAVPAEILPEEELKLAISNYRNVAKSKADIDKQISNNTSARSKIADINSAEYKKLLDEYTQLSYLSQQYSSIMDNASTRANEMAQYNENAVLAYQKIVDNGGVLTDSQLQTLNTAKGLNLEYIGLVKEIHNAASSMQQMEKAQNGAFRSPVKTKEEVASLKYDVNAVAQSYAALNTALANQDTGKSVQLTDELSDYATCLEYVNGTMQINSEKARELAKAKSDEKLALIETQDALEKAQYLKNSRDIDRYTDLLGKNEFVMVDGIKVTDEYIQSLKNSNQQIVTNCDQYSLFASQIRQASGAYQEWLASQNASEAGDMFTDAGNAIKAIQEGLSNGKINTVKYNAAVKFLIPDTIDSNDQAEVTKYLETLEHYLADNGSGIENFIADSIENGLMKPAADGLAEVMDGITVQDFVDRLKITPEVAQAIFGELSEYGWEFGWEHEGIATLDDALFESKQALDTLKESYQESLITGINVNELRDALKEAESVYESLQSKVREEVDAGIKTDDFESDFEKFQLLEEAITENDRIKQVSTHGGDFSDLESYVEELNEKLKTEYDIDISDASLELDIIKEKLQSSVGLNEITITAYVDDAENELSAIQSQIDEINAKPLQNIGDLKRLEYLELQKDTIQKNIEIVQTFKLTEDPSVSEAEQRIRSIDELTIEGKTFTIDADISMALDRLQTVKNNINELNNTTVSPRFKITPFQSPIQFRNGQGGTDKTAYVNGHNGTSKTETALIGEVGREIVVDPATGKWRTYGNNGPEFARIRKGSIIFNTQQTEELLSRGFINSHGSAYLSGTAHYGNGGNQEAKKQTKEYDWIKTALEYISRERDKVADSIKDENVSYQKQLSLLQELLSWDKQLTDTNEISLNKYRSQWSDTVDAILQQFGEVDGNSLIAKIKQGDTSPDGWKNTYNFDPDDEAMVAKTELLDKAIELYTALIGQEEAYDDALVQTAEDQRSQFEIRVNMIKDELEEIDSAMSKAESGLSIKETTGRIITEADYREMISLAEDQIGLYYDQIDVLEEYLDGLDEGSAEWYNVKSQIASCSNAVLQCEENQAKWNEEILNLPIRRIERYLALLNNIKKDITNKISEQGSLGINATKEQLQSLIDISSLQIDKLREQHSLLTGKLGNYQYGSDKFNDVKNEIQDVEDEISSLIQSQQDWNKQILQIPLDNITKLNKRLQDILDALDGVTDRFDTAIQAVTAAVEDQVSAVNDLKDAAAEEYEAKLKPYQDELKLLQKQNQERGIQLELEQAAYDLKKANSQKTTQVVRNGEIVYEADQDAVRNAAKANADAEYNKAVHDLEQQVKSLEDERDGLLENYDKQIEKLDEIKEKWSEIASNIEKAQNASVADEVLGSGWQEQIISGDDAVYNMLKGNYENIAAQKNLYEKQIDSNDKITALMEQYITAYQDGTMSFEQAVSQFDSLINSARDGFSALENLQAVLGSAGSSDSNSALAQIQGNLNASFSDFKEYLKTANTNSETISKYTSTWEEIKKTLEEQLAALKKLAEEESKKVSNSKPSSSGGGGGKGHSSSKGPNWNTPDGEATGPAKEIEEREKLKKSIPAYKDGIENGAVQQQANDIIAKLKRLGTEKLEHDEVLSILHPGEIVLNKEQQNLLLQNINNIPFITPMITPLPLAADSINKSPEFNFQTEINLNSVDNTQKLVDALNREWEPALRQAYSKL